jgi:hypothetical protein
MLLRSKLLSQPLSAVNPDRCSLRRCHFQPRKGRRAKRSNEKWKVPAKRNKPAMGVLKTYWMIEVDVAGNGNGSIY